MKRLDKLTTQINFFNNQNACSSAELEVTDRFVCIALVANIVVYVGDIMSKPGGCSVHWGFQYRLMAFLSLKCTHDTPLM